LLETSGIVDDGDDSVKERVARIRRGDRNYRVRGRSALGQHLLHRQIRNVVLSRKWVVVRWWLFGFGFEEEDTEGTSVTMSWTSMMVGRDQSIEDEAVPQERCYGENALTDKP